MTVAMYFAKSKIPLTNEWKYKPKDGQSFILARNGIIPSPLFQHDPEKTDEDDMTVAMLLAVNGVVV